MIGGGWKRRRSGKRTWWEGRHEGENKRPIGKRKKETKKIKRDEEENCTESRKVEL